MRERLEQKIAALLENSILRDVERWEHSWSFAFDAATLTVECDWRATAGRVLVSNADHEASRAARLLRGARVRRVIVADGVRDLALHLGPELRLEISADRRPYEAWQLHSPGSVIVCMAGKLSEARPRTSQVWTGSEWE